MSMHIRHQIKIFWIALLIASVPIIITTINDPDLYFHMATGKDMVINHTVDYSKYYYSQVTDNYADQRYTFLGDIILYMVHFIGQDVGLILLRVLMVAMCCYFLFMVSDLKPDFFKLLLLVLLVLGTYQLQMIRNSIISLGCLSLLFYMIDNRRYFGIIFLLLSWCCIHGSYLLAFAFLCILAVCDVLDKSVYDRSIARKHILLWGLCIAVCFIVINFNNPLTASYFNVNSVKNVVQSSSLNATIFKSDPNLLSFDFQNPFLLDRWYIRVSFMVAVFTLCVVRPIRFKYVIPFIAIMTVGLGYVRMVGYIPIVCCYILFTAQRSNHIRKIPQTVCAVILLMVAIGIYTHTDKLLFSFTEFGFKRNMIYSDRCAKIAAQKYKGEITFNTMDNGSYLLWLWYPGKRVFIDTHFAPHPNIVFTAYKGFCNNPEQLKQVCRSAIIPFNTPKLIKNFIKAGWYAEYIDSGNVLLSSLKCEVKVLVDQKEYDRMSDKHKRIFNVVLSICKGV
ncbi:hypothetical protein [Pseudoalteromonas sp.]|uniref:hypothetical protein n=1 Tax=Pseudoalteromonas sp. TaxID=53249 RepID=UPI00260E3BB1|nr:hypothetical protein [Pseudoalteromonas sp.]MCP4585357.1 hypothetical protein [Pseudoalteromonas sp.]